jgi:hypothetical protein
MIYILPSYSLESAKKEYILGDMIINFAVDIENLEVKCNQQIKGLPYKPDISITQANGSKIYIEIDEHCHKSYKADRERDDKIMKTVNGCTIIRINVDKYTYNGITYNPIWRKEVLYIDKDMVKIYKIITDREELFKRFNVLKETINDSLNALNINNIVHLFYNSP